MRYCNKCGAQLGEQDSFCPVCGTAAGNAGGSGPSTVQNCPACGSAVGPNDQFCANCGAPTGNPSQVYQGQVYRSSNQRSKLVAGLLGIFVGGFGIHNFYLGNISIGVIQIIVTLVTCGLGSLWGFIEGILILCDRITVDGEGKPLAP